MTDEEVVSQIPVFVSFPCHAGLPGRLIHFQLLAGNVTTSSVLTWAMITLSQNSSMQDRLRSDIMSVQNDMPDLEVVPLPQSGRELTFRQGYNKLVTLSRSFHPRATSRISGGPDGNPKGESGHNSPARHPCIRSGRADDGPRSLAEGDINLAS